MMLNKRSIVAWMMALLVAFLASCGSPAPPPTYSDAQLQKIEQYTTGIVALRDRMDELNTLIQKGDWVNVDTFIHGPLGDLRSKTNYLTQSLLLPKDKTPVLDAAKEVFQDLEEIDVAAAAGDKLQATNEYKKAIADFDTFFGLIPKSN
ncbi:MAG: photosystem II protein PsbQ [Okeania sp. SIO2C9]|uniref:photosystem II protein PsbQ n=1 Tax=Okeania sp. SIO2C9 TaxID=2607791 RepID=UPI0013BF8139|nr:photosystem II protein PsbQ [Okeania sp. SIO2C9]NEQ71672.1 photosystem II protein PsbQ [Okeania sp. SIO2C9]